MTALLLSKEKCVWSTTRDVFYTKINLNKRYGTQYDGVLLNVYFCSIEYMQTYDLVAINSLSRSIIIRAKQKSSMYSICDKWVTYVTHQYKLCEWHVCLLLCLNHFHSNEHLVSSQGRTYIHVTYAINQPQMTN